MNKQLTENYVSYEIAKLLKEKGFKQDCDYATSWYAAEYYKNSAQGEWFEGEHEIIKDIDDKCTISYLSDKGVFIPAPTQSLALKWLREVHNIFISPDLDVYSNLYFATVYTQLQCATPNKHYSTELYINPKQSVDATLLYVLKNLI